jgi:hypothetical protein
MRESHAAGWPSDSPTAAQLKEFFGQVEKGKITKDRFQAFLRGEPAVEDLMTEAERLAVEIFGPGKVLGCRDICRVQKIGLLDTEPTMPFSEDVLHECAGANAQGANWRLAYVTGLSLRQERAIMGWDRRKQPCFDPDWSWWTESAQDPWANQPAEPGYRLYDFTKRFSSLRWQDQTDEITKLGTNFERAEEQAVTEICFSNFLLSSNKERLMLNWYHWGELRAACGSRVCVGRFGQSGFRVSNGWGDDPYDRLGVVLARKSRALSP